MPARASKVEKPVPPAKASIDTLAAFMGIPAKSLRDMIGTLGLPPTGLHDTRQTVQAVVAHIRTKADRARNPENRNRKDAAEAERFEIKAAKERNEVMLREDNTAQWKDGFRRLLQTLQSAHYIAPALRDRLGKEMRAVKLDTGDED